MSFDTALMIARIEIIIFLVGYLVFTLIDFWGDSCGTSLHSTFWSTNIFFVEGSRSGCSSHVRYENCTSSN